MLRPSDDGCELQVELLHAAQDVRRDVLIAAGAGRAVLRFRDPDVGHAVEEAFDAHARLGARERRTGTAVDAEPERDLVAGVGAVDAELRRALEPARIAVRGAVE